MIFRYRGFNRYSQQHEKVTEENWRFWVINPDTNQPDLVAGNRASFIDLSNTIRYGDIGQHTRLRCVDIYVGVIPDLTTPAQEAAWSAFLDSLVRTIDVLETPYPTIGGGLETPCDLQVGGDTGRCPHPQMMEYSAHAASCSLRVQDAPLTYTPAFGPALPITIYSTEGLGAAPAGTGSLGPGWSCSLYSWLEDDPQNAAAAVRVHEQGGGVESYAGYNSAEQTFTANRWANAVVQRTLAGTYERHFSDGRLEIYGLSDAATTGTRRFYLTEVRDSWGNASVLSYSGLRLDSLTDATGKITSLLYDPVDSTRLWKIVDPFGRAAVLGYNAAGRLASCTDPAGTLSEVSYATGGKIATMSTPYGPSTFSRGSVGSVQWLEMLDARNAKERVEFRYQQPAPVLDPATFFLQIAASPRQPGVIEHWAARDPADFTVCPYEQLLASGLNNAPNVIKLGPWNGVWSRAMSSADFAGARGGTTYFWDKKATGETQMQDEAARQFGWAFDGGGVSGSPAWTKPALDAVIQHFYKDQTQPGYAPNALVAASYRSSDGLQKAQQTQAEYNNPLGKITKSVDPVGRMLSNIYDPVNYIDLREVRNVTGSLNELLMSYSDYLNHQPQTIIDAAGQPTYVTYNARGQVDTITNAKGEIIKFLYVEDPLAPAYGRLLSVTRAFGRVFAATTTYGYDAYGRLASVQGSDGYTVVFTYDAIDGDPLQTLDRVVRVTYPDGTYSESRYDDARWPLDVAHTRDRLGRETAYEYDALRNLTKMTDPNGRVTQFVTCPCGATDKIIDPSGRETEWVRDLQKRVTKKKIGGQIVASYGYESDTGRLSTIADATLPTPQITHLSYFEDDNIHTIAYENALHPTADVTFTSDPNYNRMATMLDGLGLHTYNYVPINPSDTVYGDGQLQSMMAPQPGGGSVTIGYNYDELGRRIGRNIDGAANAMALGFDVLGRTSGVTNPLGTFTPTYVDTTNRLDHVDWPNGQKTQYLWFPVQQDRRLQRIQHVSPAQQVQSQHDYTHDVESRIQTWDMQAADTKRYEFGYNASDELEQALLKQLPGNTLLQTNQYGYDVSANRVSVLRDSEFTSFGTNAKNQLTTSSGTGVMKFRGTVSKDSGITLSGFPGIVTGSPLTGFTWEATSPVAAGLNHLELRATEVRDIADVAAQTTVRHIDINVTAGPSRTLAYDNNGSVTNNGAGQTYEWDAANRMYAINYTGTNKRTEFTHDGMSHRVRIVEKVGTAIVSDRRFVWDGNEIVEERDALNVLVKQFYQEGVRIAGANFYYARDHIGSIRDLTDATGIIQARYEYDPWGERTKLAGNLDADFGFTGHYQHNLSGLVASPSRFYIPPLGRWLSRDPIGEEGGINLYNYVDGNPVSDFDELGLSPHDVQVIKTAYQNKLGEMTRTRERLSPGIDSNIEQSMSLLLRDEKSPDLSCGGQALNIERYFRTLVSSGRLSLDSNWTVKPMQGFWHCWTQLESSDPRDPILKLDPWKGKFELISRKP